MSVLVSSIGAIVALLIVIGCLFVRMRGKVNALLVAALLVTALMEVFDCRSLVGGEHALFWKHMSIIMESLLPFFWFAATLTYARQQSLVQLGRIRLFLLSVTVFFTAVPFFVSQQALYYSPDFPTEPLLFLGNAGYFFYLGVMLSLVFSLVNLETTVFNASPDNFQRIKYELIGYAVILGVLAFYYSQAMLYRALNMNYVQVRHFLYLVAAGLILFSLIRSNAEVRIQVSRQVALKSMVIFTVGMYLIVLGLLGEGMQYFGVSFSRTLATVFALLGGVILVVLMVSERIRRELKVFLHKNFYQQKYDYRTQWLRLTEQLSSSRSADELLRRILSAYCDVFGITGGTLFLYRDGLNGYTMTASYNMDPIESIVSVDNSLVDFLKEREWVVNTKDNTPEVTPENGHFFTTYGISLIVPLVAEKQLEGFIMLGKQVKANEVYIYEDYDLMKTIARQASLAILYQKLSEQVTQSREIEAIGSVSTFVIHDLKNLVSNLSLIVENATRYIHNTDFQHDMLASLGNTVEKMQRLIGRLKKLGERDQLQVRPVDILELVQQTTQMTSGAVVEVSGVSKTVVLDANEIQKVLLNLIMNAVEAMDHSKQPIEIKTGMLGGSPYISVADHGCGMTAEYVRNDMFKPFKTTKKNGLGIGLYQCRQIMDAHGGKIEVVSSVGIGSTFTLWFPPISATHY